MERVKPGLTGLLVGLLLHPLLVFLALQRVPGLDPQVIEKFP